ncbi:MAG: hypothetical protein HYY17_04000 [Planctomycetes bacterium]|nr:hypothetical protein [Planctomycetota bacterium]
MTNGPQLKRYESRYPREGDVAILCEGDIVGYEVELLERWLAIGRSRCAIDVWPCGTKSAIMGMSDAIGRGVPIVVIEDRDFRTREEATKDTEESRKDRRDRLVRIASWKTWERNEIENYLVEPAVVLPALSVAFGVSEEDVRLRLGHVVESLRIDQAAQYALNVCWARLPHSHARRFIVGLPKRTARPQWDSTRKTIIPALLTVVTDALRRAITDTATRLSVDVRALDIEEVLKSFQGKCNEWAGTTTDDTAWRVDWAGKDVLGALCRSLTGEFGWPPISSRGAPIAIDWSLLADQKKDAELDRDIATVLQPRLIDSFLNYLGTSDGSPIRQEWDSLAIDIVEASKSEALN